MKNKLYILAILLFTIKCFGQVSDSAIVRLKMDTAYAFLQYENPNLAERLQEQLSKTNEDQFVVFHYGGSHIQGGMPPNQTRKLLQEKYGNGGSGMLFNYGAADTYSSVNYSSSKTGVWSFAKSFQGSPKIPLGVAGMSVETAQSAASLIFRLKNTIPAANHVIEIFTEEGQANPFGIEVILNGKETFSFDTSLQVNGCYRFDFSQAIDDIKITTIGAPGKKGSFRFYGMSIEMKDQKGVVYHSLGVGAAAFSSVLRLKEMPEQATVLKPDMVVLDFGTNDILYTNRVAKNLSNEIEKAIKLFKTINPNILIVLTTTQDLYFKKKTITACMNFRDLVDSIARAQDCFVWNWFDLSGGTNNIRNWGEKGYAQTDLVHLSPDGYKVKGDFLYQSIENSLKFWNNNKLGKLYVEPRMKAPAPEPETVVTTPKVESIPEKPFKGTKPVRDKPSNEVVEVQAHDSTGLTTVEVPVIKAPVKSVVKKKKPTHKTHTVKSGETLSAIGRKYGVGVSVIKKTNGLRSDIIQPGQRLKIPI